MPASSSPQAVPPPEEDGGGRRFPTAFTVLAAVLALVWIASFFVPAGVITFTAKDLRDPARELPRTMYLALGIATVIYVAVALGVFGTLSVETVISSGGTALAVAAEPTLGKAGFWLIGQFPPAMARRFGGRLPMGLVVTAAIAIVLVIGFDLSSIASIGSAIALLVFGLVTFTVTTLVHETKTLIAMGVILALSVLLDFGWRRPRGPEPEPAGPAAAFPTRGI